MREYRFNLGDRKHQIHGLFIFILLVIFMFYEESLSTAIMVYKEQLFNSVKFDINVIGFKSNFPFYMYILLQIPIGLLYDRVSSRKIIPLAILLCAIGSLLLAWFSHVHFVHIARVILAIGAPFAFLGVFVMVTRWFPPHLFGVLAGFGQFMGAIGLVVASLSIEALVQYYFSWGAVMVMVAVFGMALALMCYLVVWDNPLERLQVPDKRQYQLEFREMIKAPQTYWTGLYAFCGWGALIGFSAVTGGSYLQARYGISTNDAAIRMAVLWLGFGVMSPVAGFLSQSLGRRVIILRFSSGLGVLVSILFLYLNINSIEVATLLLFLIGMASSAHILSYALVKERTYLTSVGVAFSINNFATQLGALFGMIAVKVVLSYFHVEPSGFYAGYVYRFALFVIPLLYLLAFIVSTFFLKETHCEQRIEGDMI